MLLVFLSFGSLEDEKIACLFPLELQHTYSVGFPFLISCRREIGKMAFIAASFFTKQHCSLSTLTGRMQDNERLCVYPFYQSGETMWGSHAFPPASCQGLCCSVLLPWITCDKKGVLVKYYLASNTLICIGHILLHTSLKRRILLHLPPHPVYSLGF